MTTAPVSWVGLELENGRYHVTAALGEGGMAYIYRAIDRKRQRDVVLKVPKPALLADPEFVHRFAREVKTLVELKHPSIVSVFGFGRHMGLPFVVLEYMPGSTLDDRTKPSTIDELKEWVTDIAAALDHIHANGYVHRDVKPSNVLFDSKGRARLSDFGVIKSIDEKVGQTRALTESGVAVGTPEYMAPELARGESFDGKVDQYALAITVYEMLVGRRPIDGGTGPVILVKQIQETPIPLNVIDASIPAPLAAAVGRALSKDPRKRFASCTEFAQLIESVIDNRPIRVNSQHKYEAKSIPFKWIASLGLMVLVALATTAWMKTRPDTVVEIPSGGSNLVAKDKVDETVPATGEHFTIQASADPGFVGKPNSILVRVDRKGVWNGPVQVQLVEPLSDCRFEYLSATILTDDVEHRFEFNPRRAMNNVLIKIQATGSQSTVQETTANVTAKAPAFTVTPLDAVDMAPGESRFVSVFLNREGFDDEVELILRTPPGVRIEPNTIRFAQGATEATVKLTATTGGKAPNMVRLMYNGLEKARFDVRVVATSITPATPNRPSKTKDEIGQLITREAGSISGLAFHPKDTNTLAIWTDRGWVHLWDIEEKNRKGGQHLSTAGTRGTFSPDGRQIVSCGQNLVHLMNGRGETVSQGASSHRILGVYYDGQFPHFWTASGVCNYLGKLVQPSAPGKGVTKIKYATAGSTHSVRDMDGKIQWRHGNAIQNFDPAGAIEDFAISHDGRWVAVASPGEVIVHDSSQASAAPSWKQAVANVSAIAISPNGKQLAIGLSNGEVRILKVE